jgi:hypothetical protein
MPKHNVDLSKLPDEFSKNHFVCESQGEAASRGLVNMLRDMKQLLEKEESKLIVVKEQVEVVTKAIQNIVNPINPYEK